MIIFRLTNLEVIRLVLQSFMENQRVKPSPFPGQRLVRVERGIWELIAEMDKEFARG